MTIVTVSPQYRIAIPPEFRKPLRIKPGDQVAIELRGNGLRLIRLRPIEQMRGIFKGIKNDFERDPDRTSDAAIIRA